MLVTHSHRQRVTCCSFSHSSTEKPSSPATGIKIKQFAMANSDVEFTRHSGIYPVFESHPDSSQYPSGSGNEVELESFNGLPPHEFSLPPVDRGKDAWLFLAASFVLEALIWGKSTRISRYLPIEHQFFFMELVQFIFIYPKPVTRDCQKGYFAMS